MEVRVPARGFALAASLAALKMADLSHSMFAGAPKFNHFEFVAACAAFPRAPLSIGWTTGPPQSSSLPLPVAASATASAESMPQSSEVGYEDEHVEEMIELCKQGMMRIFTSLLF